MRKLLSSPVKMSLSAAENQIYQNALKYVTPLSLNLMAVKVDNRPDDFTTWCGELNRLCREELNLDFLDDEQFAPLKKLQQTLADGFAISQLKMARIAPWQILVGFIEQQTELHALDERLRLLSYIDKLRHLALAEMSNEDRLVFAGKHTSQHAYHIYDFDCEWFASTKGAKVFHLLLEQFPDKFDAALANIPLTGSVNYDHYQNFVMQFLQIFKDGTQEPIEKSSETKAVKSEAPLAAATRLLAMRRPDQFIALSNSKIDIFCKGLSIAKFSNTDFSSYWHDMIATVRTFPWWNQVEPAPLVEGTIDDSVGEIIADEINAENDDVNYELTLWNNRAILIDLFLFADVDLAQNSNYVRARDKVLNKSTNNTKSKSTYKKISKESIESLVDKALMSDDLPEYMSSKRDSIISQVKKGKTIEQAIGLLRAIFG